MKKLITLLMLISASAYGAFTTNEVSTIVDMSKVTGNRDQFYYKWGGRDTQKMTFTITTDGSSGATMAGNTVAIKVSKQSPTGQVDYISFNSADNTNNVIISTTQVIVNIANTNIPPNGPYEVDLWAWQGATTNVSRTLAQGKVNVFNSLYDVNNPGSYPWPSAQTNLADYVTLAGTETITGPKSMTNTGNIFWGSGANLTGWNMVTNLNDLTDVVSVTTPTDQHVLTYRTGQGWTNEAAAGGSGTTNASGVNADFASPTNYTAGDVNVDDHLIGIDSRLGNIVKLGTVTQGVWNATVVDQAYLDANVVLNNQNNDYSDNTTQKIDSLYIDLTNLITGISSAEVMTTSSNIQDLANVDSVASPTTGQVLLYDGSAWTNGNPIALGTVTGGTWQGTAIADAYVAGSLVTNINDLTDVVSVDTPTDGHSLVYRTGQGWTNELVSGGAGSQTPWTNNVSGAGYNLSGVSVLTVNTNAVIGNGTQTNGTQLTIGGGALAPDTVQFKITNSTTAVAMRVDEDGDVRNGGLNAKFEWTSGVYLHTDGTNLLFTAP